MNTIPMTTSTLSSVPACFLFQDRTYKYVENGKVTGTLPKVELEYKEILDELNIPYELDAAGTSYEIWVPECFEERTETLPMYIGSKNNYRMVKKYTGTVVSTESVKAANSLLSVVQAKIDAFKQEQEQLALIAKQEQEQLALIAELKKALNGNTACGVDCSCNRALSSCKGRTMELVHGDTHIMVMPVCLLLSAERQARLRAECYEHFIDISDEAFVRGTNYIAIFDMADLTAGATIDIFVPEGTEPIFVGRKGWQVRKWCEKLGGLLKINVKVAVQ